MTVCQEALDNFRRADGAYQDALAEADTLKRARDEAVLAMTRSATVRDVAAATGLSPARVQQIVSRARESG
jgi:DNA-directed RNA polymerase specialized sigma subunit